MGLHSLAEDTNQYKLTWRGYNHNRFRFRSDSSERKCLIRVKTACEQQLKFEAAQMIPYKS